VSSTRCTWCLLHLHPGTLQVSLAVATDCLYVELLDCAENFPDQVVNLDNDQDRPLIAQGLWAQALVATWRTARFVHRDFAVRACALPRGTHSYMTWLRRVVPHGRRLGLRQHLHLRLGYGHGPVRRDSGDAEPVAGCRRLTNVPGRLAREDSRVHSWDKAFRHHLCALVSQPPDFESGRC
jgi:hypothetical protein